MYLMVNGEGMLRLVSLVLAVVLAKTCCGVVHDVYPEATCLQSGVGAECFTLSDIVKEKNSYFVSNSTLVFHDGQHVLHEGIMAVSNISDFTMQAYAGRLSNSPTVKFTCVNSSLSLSDVSRGQIVSIEFSHCSISLTRTIVAFHNIRIENGLAVNGGAIAAYSSHVQFYGGNTFLQNTARELGGAIYSVRSEISFSGNAIFTNNYARDSGGAVAAINNNNLCFMATSRFMGNIATLGDGGAIFAGDSNVLNFTGRNIFTNNTAANSGGAVHGENANMLYFVGNSIFVSNTAGSGGGAVNIMNDNQVRFSGDISFVKNAAVYYGGAVEPWNNNVLNFIGKISFIRNTANNGGAIYAVYQNHFNLTGTCMFLGNTAHDGGSIFTGYGNTLDVFGNSSFQSNLASYDGGAVIAYLQNTFNFVGDTCFINNIAGGHGGAVTAVEYQESNTFNFSGNTLFGGNTADYGGAVEVCGCKWSFAGNNTFVNNTARYNGGGVYVQVSSCMRFDGKTIIEGNMAIQGLGGGGFVQDSRIECTGTLGFAGNKATYGGGLFLKGSNITIQGVSSFVENAAFQDGHGGAIFAFGAVRFEGSFEISNNTAGFGGGLAFSGINDGFFLLKSGSILTFNENKAYRRGGAIYVEDNPFTFCSFDQTTRYSIDGTCFFQVTDNICLPLLRYQTDPPFTLTFSNNTAVESGDSVYGGHLESCVICIRNAYYFDLGSEIAETIAQSEVDTYSQVSSHPYKLCFCENKHPNCEQAESNVTVYPGQKMTTSVVAVGQLDGTVPSVIRAISENLTNTTDLRVTQPAENNKACSQLQYPLHSTMSEASLKLYADEPCSTSGPPLTYSIAFLPCPMGFTLSEEGTCTCDQRLEKYTQSCSVQNLTISRRKHESFWTGVEALGLILHPHCPFDYCTDESTSFTLNSTDLQCASGRSGVLCGACQHGYSLALGSSRCLPGCTNTPLALLLAFAVAGVFLVAFLFLCRLTVAEGTLSGLIFYANILAINRNVFFLSGDQNLLTVFIAWLNLDLGIETCFFVGLDAYYRTWLQFAFPIYIWVLEGTIVVVANRSTIFARLIGNTNPVAILATLFLLSYTKLLRAIMAVFTFTTLEYPNSSHKYVWLYDGNIEYLDNSDARHISLFLFSLLFCLLIFLPYSFLLLCGQWIQNRLSWLSPTKQLYVKAFLEAYYAPYKDSHRYWTGFLLLLRFLLLFVTTIIDIHNPQDPFSNLLVVLLVALTACCWTTRGIYKKWYLDLLEASFSFNLIILVGGTYQIRLSGGDQAALVYTSTGIALVIFLGVIAITVVQWVQEMFPKLQSKAIYLAFHKDQKHSQDDTEDSMYLAGFPSLPRVRYSSVTIAHPRHTSGRLDLRQHRS